MSRRLFIKASIAAAAIAFAGVAGAQQKTVKVGVLHSLSGTMAITETVLKDVVLMAVDEINAKGGVHGLQGRAGGRRPGLQLAAVRREGAPADHPGQGRRGVRLLDLGLAEVRAAGVRGAERPPLLSGAVRGRGDLEERVLHRRRAQPAGDPGGRVPDVEGGRRRQALGAARHRLRLSAHDQQDPARFPEVQGRRRQGHRREVHALRPRRLPDDRGRHQEVLRRRQDRGGLDHQRRLERAVLQGARATRASRRPTSRSWRSRWAKRSCAASTPSRWSATSRRGTTSCRSRTPRTTSGRRSGRPTPRRRSCRTPTSR